MHAALAPFVCTVAFAIGVGAQTRPQEAERQPPQSQATVDVHTEASSRELFSACDGNSDDRLDLFEACEALDMLGDPLDSEAFLHFDGNRDGYLEWSEFDAIFRAAIDRGESFRVRTCRRFVQRAPELQEAKPASPMEQLLHLHDKHGNGGLDPDELKKLARDLGIPTVSDTQIKMLDLDQSGRLEPLELAPWFDRIRGSVPGLPAAAPQSTLPSPWSTFDTNGDGAVDLAELTAALRRIDPGLTRWAATLLGKYDLDKDGRIRAGELPKANPAPAGNAAGRHRES